MGAKILHVRHQQSYPVPDPCENQPRCTSSARRGFKETTGSVYGLIRSYNIPAGSFTYDVEHLFQDNVPSRVLIGLIRTEAFTGNFQLNSFNFADHDVSDVVLYFDGIAKRAIKTNYRDSQISQGYSSIFKAFGQWGMDNHSIGLMHSSGFTGHLVLNKNWIMLLGNCKRISASFVNSIISKQQRFTAGDTKYKWGGNGYYWCEA